MTFIAIIDYGSGNLHSIGKAFEVSSRKFKNTKVKIIKNPEELKEATHIVLPGVGAFYDCIKALKEIPNMIEALEENVLEKKKHFLGVCVGMQILAERSFEHSENKGLSWIKGEVLPIKKSKDLRIPHTGWNSIKVIKDHKVFKGIEEGDDFYFVHSYHFKCVDKKDIAMEVEYGDLLTAAVIRDNIIAVQFHPEKSQDRGLKFIQNFISI